ncbi:MAG: type II/IV secretion system ATPase subunit (plasmid) [Candidatus Methanoperedens sp.]|nr:MAG: type II/IV secretion system ATPase subunit [Candidatus Methanoperedens sp.]
MLDIFKSESKPHDIKAAVKTVPLKLDFLDEDLPVNELCSDFVIMPVSANTEIISKIAKGLEGKTDRVMPVNPGIDIDIKPPAAGPASCRIWAELIDSAAADESSDDISRDNIKIPAKVREVVDMPAPLQNNGGKIKNKINNKPRDKKNLLAVKIERGAGAVEIASSESPILTHTMPDLILTLPEIKDNGGDVGVKEKGRYNDVLTQILDIARSDPGDYGWKSHSLKNLQKHLIAKKIVKKISYETLRNILRENSIQWNGRDNHHKNNNKNKKKIDTIKTPIIDENVREGGGACVEEDVNERAICNDSKNTLQAQPGGLTTHKIVNENDSIPARSGQSLASIPHDVAQSYYPMDLKDYQKSEVTALKNEIIKKPSENTASIANDISYLLGQGAVKSGTEKKKSDDVDVPPGIVSDVNNIKIFGHDFDPGRLDVVESYSISHPIENPTIYIVKDGYKLRYLIKEPEKPEVYDEVRKVILRNVDILSLDENKTDPVAILNNIIAMLKKKYSELKKLNKDEEHRLMYYLYRDFIGYREIDAAMRDEFIEDITCVGYGIPMFIYHQKYYNLVGDLVFQERDLDSIVLWMAQVSGKHISISEPIVDATLKDGSRAQLTFKKTATDKGSTFTVRRFKSGNTTPVDLVRSGTYSLEAMAYLWKCVQSGKNVLFVGGTATGKTTNLNACGFFIPPEVKIVSIEDTREIKLYQKNWIPSISTRDIDVFALLKAALRQRPEYILVGEVRGKEAQTLFQAMSSGHTVMSTFHAGSVEDMVNRLTNSPIDVPPTMLESINIVLILKNQWTGASSRHRFVDGIYEQRRIDGIPRFVKVYDHAQGLSASLINRELEHKISCLHEMIDEKLTNPDKVSERIMSHMYSGVETQHD